uniref:Transformer 2 protein beta n=1 Tax=Echinococcus granulosus TaxID=6210 RepID=A0A068X167_ECHGR|nr:transformer 2 protein beta [Echinococcus granulosus]
MIVIKTSKINIICISCFNRSVHLKSYCNSPFSKITVFVSVTMSYDSQDYGSRLRRSRYDTYDSPPMRGRQNDYVAEERHHRSFYRPELRPRYRDYDEMQDRRLSAPRRDYFSRRGGGGSDYYSGPPPRRTEQARPCKVLGVFGLSIHTTERDLYNVFSIYGRVRDIHMVYDNMSGRSRGFAFVYYDSTEDARRAKTSCEGGLDIDGKVARVDYSLTTAPHRPTPGIYMGRRYDDDRRRGRPYDRPPRYSRYPDDDIGPSYGRMPPRYCGNDMSPSMGRPVRDRSPIRPSRHSQRSGVRRRTVSSSRSRSPPPVYNGGRKVSDGSPERSRKSGTGNSVGGGATAGAKVVDEAWSDAE